MNIYGLISLFVEFGDYFLEFLEGETFIWVGFVSDEGWVHHL